MKDIREQRKKKVSGDSVSLSWIRKCPTARGEVAKSSAKVCMFYPFFIASETGISEV